VELPVTVEKLYLPELGENCSASEFPITFSGVEFTGAILEEHVPQGRKYYRGMYSAFRDGFILSFDAEAASPEKVNELGVRVVSLAK
jgi:hypothetical protein